MIRLAHWLRTESGEPNVSDFFHKPVHPYSLLTTGLGQNGWASASNEWAQAHSGPIVALRVVDRTVWRYMLTVKSPETTALNVPHMQFLSISSLHESLHSAGRCPTVMSQQHTLWWTSLQHSAALDHWRSGLENI